MLAVIYVIGISSLPPSCLRLLTRSNQIAALPWPSSSSSSLWALGLSQED